MKILIATGDGELDQLMSRYFARVNMPAILAGDGEDIVKKLQDGEVDLVLMGAKLKKISTVDLVRFLEQNAREQKVWRLEDLTLEWDRRRVMREDQMIKLKNKEFLLLGYLLKNQGKVLGRLDIYEAVWGKKQVLPQQGNTVNTHMAALRAKVDRGFTRKLIHTVHGVGYRME